MSCLLQKNNPGDLVFNPHKYGSQKLYGPSNMYFLEIHIKFEPRVVEKSSKLFKIVYNYMRDPLPFSEITAKEARNTSVNNHRKL